MDAHTLDLSMLPAERRRFLHSVGNRLTDQALMRREAARRHPILLAVLAQSAIGTLDDVVALFDQAVSAREGRAKRKLTSALANRAKSAAMRAEGRYVDDEALGDEAFELGAHPFDLGRFEVQVGAGHSAVTWSAPVGSGQSVRAVG